MITVHFFIQVLALCLSFVSLALALVLYHRYRSDAIKKYALFILFFLLFYFVMLIIFYYNYIVTKPDLSWIILVYEIGFCAVGFLIYTAASAAAGLLDLDIGKPLKFVLLGLSIIPAIGTFLNHTIFYGQQDLVTYLMFHHSYILLVFGLELIIIEVLFIIRINNSKNPEQRFLLTGVSLIIGIYIPFFLKDVVGDIFKSTKSNYNWGTYLYLLWHISGIVISLKYLLSSTSGFLTPSAEPDDSFIQKYSITGRESEIIRLIGEGYGNKEIANRLYLSLSTIRNHIYNIFKKTGVKTRIDLLNRIGRKK
jgi:DNA-binding CsgD family transcriptional regulator